jgi:hypothetical protein
VGELTRWKPQDGELVPAPGARIYSLDLSRPEGQRAAYRAHVGADFRLVDLVGQTIEVEHFYAHHVTRVDEETGEERPGTRCVLIQPDGTRISTGSDTAMKCMLAWAAIASLQPPWNPPLRFLVREEKRTKGPGKWLWLDVAL